MFTLRLVCQCGVVIACNEYFVSMREATDPIKSEPEFIYRARLGKIASMDKNVAVRNGGIGQQMVVGVRNADDAHFVAICRWKSIWK